MKPSTMTIAEWERRQSRAAEYEEQLRREGRPDARSTARQVYGLEPTRHRERDPDEVIAALPPVPRDVRDAMVASYAQSRSVEGDGKAEIVRQRHVRAWARRKAAADAARDPARLDLRTVGHRGKRAPGSRWGWTGGTP